MAGKKIGGTIPEEQMDKVEGLVENGPYDSKSEFVRFAVRYTLSEKHKMR